MQRVNTSVTWKHFSYSTAFYYSVVNDMTIFLSHISLDLMATNLFIWISKGHHQKWNI